MPLDLDTAARIELARHQEGMLYAEKQLLKRGEYEQVALGVLRRARWKAVLFVSLGAGSFLLSALTKGQQSVILVVVAVASYVDYLQARRTAQTIRALAAADASTPPPASV